MDVRSSLMKAGSHSGCEEEKEQQGDESSVDNFSFSKSDRVGNAGRSDTSDRTPAVGVRCFSIDFASVVATIFCFLLWKRNQILYSPKDFADRDAIQFVRAMHVSRDSTVRYLDNVEREQEIALRKAEIELELLQRERGDRDRRLQIEIQLEMLKTMAARGALDDDGTMTRDLTLKLLDSLTSDAASSASGPRPEIEGGSVGGFDSEEDPDSKNDD